MTEINVEVLDYTSKNKEVRSLQTSFKDQVLLLLVFHFYSLANIKYGEKNMALWLKIEDTNQMKFETQYKGFGLISIPDNFRTNISLIIPQGSTLAIEKFDGTSWIFSGDVLPKPIVTVNNPFDSVHHHQTHGGGGGGGGGAHHNHSHNHDHALRVAQHHAAMRSREEEEEEDMRRAIELSLMDGGGVGIDDISDRMTPPPVSSPAGIHQDDFNEKSIKSVSAKRKANPNLNDDNPKDQKRVNFNNVGPITILKKEIEIVKINIEDIYIGDVEATVAMSYKKSSLYDSGDIEMGDDDIYSHLGVIGIGRFEDSDDGE